MKPLVTKSLLTLVFLISFVAVSMGQPPPPGEHGSDRDLQPAPIGGGLVMLMLLAGAYGAKKVYQMRKRMDE